MGCSLHRIFAKCNTPLAFGLALLILALAPAMAGDSAWAEEPPLWNAAWITDTQSPECEWITTLVARVQANNPRLVIHTGDTRFEWANRGAWRAVMTLLRIETPPIEFHLAPGNHDLTNGVLKLHLRRAATQGIYRLDTGEKASGFGYYHNRVPRDVSGALWPVWNPEVIAEARSNTITAILYCSPKQRPPTQPIYEMNWDSVALYEVPWPTKTSVDVGSVLGPDKRVHDLIVTVQPQFRTAQVTWGTKIPAGASQVVYRFLDSQAVSQQRQTKEAKEPKIRIDTFPFESPVLYERSAKRHWIEVDGLLIPEAAVELQVVALSRVCENGRCKTLCSPMTKLALP